MASWRRCRRARIASRCRWQRSVSACRSAARRSCIRTPRKSSSCAERAVRAQRPCGQRLVWHSELDVVLSRRISSSFCLSKGAPAAITHLVAYSLRRQKWWRRGRPRRGWVHSCRHGRLLPTCYLRPTVLERSLRLQARALGAPAATHVNLRALRLAVPPLSPPYGHAPIRWRGPPQSDDALHGAHSRFVVWPLGDRLPRAPGFLPLPFVPTPPRGWRQPPPSVAERSPQPRHAAGVPQLGPEHQLSCWCQHQPAVNQWAAEWAAWALATTTQPRGPRFGYAPRPCTLRSPR
eukprot:scaffold103212_cov24-Tisochrysis_lutea.AAC.1